MHFNKKYITFLIIIILVTLVVIELSLQALSFSFPVVDAFLSPSSITIDDERLGHRPNPNYPGHDKKGFRNNVVPDETAVVILGDSQTYGTGVRLEESWPKEFEKLARVSTYNMAFGGYGPVHSLILLEEALEFKPKLVIEAFYSGNDLFESYDFVYKRREVLNLKSNEEETIKKIVKEENINPLNEKIKNLIPRHGEFRQFFAEHSRFYGMLRAIKRVYRHHSDSFDWEISKEEASSYKKSCKVFDNGKLKTVLMSEYRLCALNLKDPRIKEGYRVSLDAIRRMKEKVVEKNSDFLVLLIPTKEMVFKEIVYKDSNDIPGSFKELVKNEEIFFKKTKDFLEKENIQYVDSLPILREAIRKNKQPYKISWDGHPNPMGHREIAKIVFSQIKKRTFAKK